MKVRAIRLTNAMGAEVAASSWLTIGHEYVVLAIDVFLAPRPSVHVLLLTDEGARSVGLFDLSDFEIVDDRPSGLWAVRFEGSQLTLQPKTWMLPLFWETFYDDFPDVRIAGQPRGIPDATERFDTAVRGILHEASAEWRNEPQPWSTSYIGER